MSATPQQLDAALDLTAFAFIGALILLSLLSLSFVILLRFKSASSSVSKPLHDFNSLWTVRLFLASFVSLWSLSQLLPLRRLRSPYRCQIHVVLSLGLLQPAVLLTILFLVSSCVCQVHRRALVAIALVLASCVPTLALQAFSVFFDFTALPFIPFQNRSFVLHDHGGESGAMCTYPPLSVLIFGVFGIGFLVSFLLSCYRVVSVVINNGLRVRIYVLAIATLASLVNQIFFLGVSALRRPGDAAHAVAELIVFLSALSCAVVGEGVLVIRPIVDSLAAVEECSQVFTDSQCLQESERALSGSPASWG